MPESTQVSNFESKPTAKEVAKSMTPEQRKAAIKELQKRKTLREIKEHTDTSTIQKPKHSA